MFSASDQSWTAKVRPIFSALLFVVLIAVVLAGWLVVAPFYYLYTAVLRVLVELLWVRNGKRVLLVYSDSPHWRDYIESTWFDRLRDRAVTLNWSERSRWGAFRPFAALVFRRWAPYRDFNPSAVVFPSKGGVKTIGFYHAFRDARYGKRSPLDRAESELFSFVEDSA